jgi:hypothetical protein
MKLPNVVDVDQIIKKISEENCLGEPHLKETW